MKNSRSHVRVGLFLLLAAAGSLCLAGMSAAHGHPAVDSDVVQDQVAKLTAADGEPADWFGSAVWLDGDTAVVGAYRADVGGNEDQGAAYIFYQGVGGAWTQVAKLAAADGADLDTFGRSVSIEGDTLVVGAAGANIDGQIRQGAVYVFYRNEGGPDGWGQVAKIVADDGEEGDAFGFAVHVDGDTIVVGASSADVGSNADQGAAYVFGRDVGGPDAWGQVAKLTAVDGAVDDGFGQSVSADGDTAIVGSFLADVDANADQGAVYVFYRNQGGADAWGQVVKLTASDGEPGDSFGTAVPVEGHTLVVGAGRARVGGNNRQGAAYVFYRDEGGPDAWGQVAKLVATDGGTADLLGVQAAISGDRVVAGAVGADIGDNVDQGAAYVFSRNAAGPGVWGQVAKLVAEDGAGYDSFGSAAAVSGNTAVSGAPQAAIGANEEQGAAYIFSLPAEANTISLADASLTYRGEDAEDWAGYSVSPAGDVNRDGFDDILIGAPYAGPGEEKGPGKAYLILGRPRGEWQPDHIDLTEADASFAGEITHPEFWDMLGRQNFTAGDINGDGYDDFLISRWQYSTASRTSLGKAYLFLGKPEIDWGWDHDVEDADASFVGENENDFASWYVSTAGDVNGDGYDDFLITATGNQEGGGQQAGQVYLFLGRREVDWGLDYDLGQADASFLGEAALQRAGRSAAAAGDVNADGYDDFVIGAIGDWEFGDDPGKAYLILGRPNADWGMDYSLALADASFLGEAAGDQLGRRVAGAGDVNGDGYDDFLMGASRHDLAEQDDVGKVYLFLGTAAADWGPNYPVAAADATFLGEQEDDQAGRRVSSAGDVNHDGYADFLACAPHNGRAGVNAGTAYLLYGRSESDWWDRDYPLALADVLYTGEAPNDRGGYDLAPAGDVDGDGVDDFLTCGYRGNENGASSGQAYVLLSEFGAPPAVPSLASPPDGTFTANHTITFTWESGIGGDPVGYNLEIDGAVITTTGTVSPTVLGTGVHTWRVRAYNETGTSDYSEFWALEIADPPGMPTLLAPEDGTITATHDITFTWEAGEGDAPDGYNLELDGAVIDTAASTYAAVLDGGEHTWRVRAYNAAGSSAYSGAWSLRILEPPGVPVLQSPLDGAVTTTQAITFTWEAGEGDAPDGYNLELDGTVITSTAPAYAVFLEFGEHGWRVRSYNLAGYSDYSAAWTLALEEPTRIIYLPLVFRND